MTAVATRDDVPTRGELLAGLGAPTTFQIIFFAVPLVMLITLSFQTTNMFLLVWSWDFATWETVLSRSYFWTTLWRTVLISVSVVTLCFLIGFPVAYAMATRLKAYENHIKVLIIFAFLTDLVLKTYGWVLLLDQHGLANWLLQSAGLVSNDFDHGLIFTIPATVIGMVYNMLPFMIFTIYLSVLAVDRELINAAYDAGASKVRTFLAITLPLCRPGIWAGCTFVFILSMGALVEEKILGGGTKPMMGALIRQTFETRVNWPLGAALTIVLIGATVLILVAFSKIYRQSRSVRP